STNGKDVESYAPYIHATFGRKADFLILKGGEYGKFWYELGPNGKDHTVGEKIVRALLEKGRWLIVDLPAALPSKQMLNQEFRQIHATRGVMIHIVELMLDLVMMTRWKDKLNRDRELRTLEKRGAIFGYLGPQKVSLRGYEEEYPGAFIYEYSPKLK